MTDSLSLERQRRRDKHKEEQGKVSLEEFILRESPSKTTVVIKNVAIPLMLDNAFIPPDLEKALNYYPNFIRHSRTDWTIQRYILELIKRIDKAKPNGYDGDKAFKEFLFHYGFYRFIRDYLGFKVTLQPIGKG
jgi:hypothetical protein